MARLRRWEKHYRCRFSLVLAIPVPIMLTCMHPFSSMFYMIIVEIYLPAIKGEAGKFEGSNSPQPSVTKPRGSSDSVGRMRSLGRP
uniref:Uncharacterized protein n=1 Tax=Oryza glaberrima TaxID=4538 RepID=I1QSN4_ORYGL